MTDIRAAIERVRATGMFSDGVDLRAVCTFAAAHLAEPAPPVAPEPALVETYNPIPRVNSVRGIGRTEDNRTAIIVSFAEEPTADEMRSFHDYVRGWQR